jgi:ABC-type uncharacterized transport system ATPase subunit
MDKVILPMSEIKARIMELSNKLGFNINPDSPISTLSVGEQQRVEILKALFRGVKILILDEPTAVLTPSETKDLFETLQQLSNNGVTIIFISHKLNEVMAISHKITVMRMGKVIGTVRKENTSPRKLAQMMVGRDVVLAAEKDKAKPKDVIVKLDNISVADENHVEIVKNFSLEIRQGEIFALTGVDGNGQTELVKAIVGLAKVSSGKIFFEGRDITNAPTHTILKSGVGYIPGDRQKQGLVLDMSIEENLIMECHDESPFSTRHLLHKVVVEDLGKQVIKEYDVRTPSSKTIVGSLSGGNQQKVVVARALLKRPKFLIAVFPTRGLDVGAIEYIHRQIVIERDRGCAILLVSTDLDEVFSLGDRIGVIYEGELMGSLSIEKADRVKVGLMMAGHKLSEIDASELKSPSICVGSN